jgi:thioesterase domain-containing protein
LGFLDSGIPPTRERRITGTLSGRTLAVLRELPYLYTHARRQGIAGFSKRFARWCDRLRRRRNSASNAAAANDDILDDAEFLNCFAEDISFFPTRRLRQIKRHCRAVFQYEPGTLTGLAQLFRVRRQPLTSVPTPTLGWEQLIDGAVEVHEVAGTHDTLMQAPHVDSLAAAVDAALAKLGNA